MSRAALIEQGVPEDLITAFLGKASNDMLFETGGGIVKSDTSLMMSGGTPGLNETYMMPDSPFAVACGITVERKKKPFIWVPGTLPFHVTDMSKLRIHCPEQYRRYAERLDHFVPVFKERLTIGGRNKNCRTTCLPVEVIDLEADGV